METGSFRVYVNHMKAKQKERLPCASLVINGVKVVLAVLVLAALSGCVGYVDGGYGGTVVVPGPDVGFYGGFHDGGHDVNVYHDRGVRSRGVAHPGGAGRKR
jgi:hypothetical protein